MSSKLRGNDAKEFIIHFELRELCIQLKSKKDGFFNGKILKND